MRIHSNPDLTVQEDDHPRWNSAPYRRHGFHNLHRLSRYNRSFRAAEVLDLRLSADLSIADRPDVARLTRLPWFSGMAVIEGNRLLYENYAADFSPDQPHSIMSISKMATHLMIGRLWEDGALSLKAAIKDILPWIGPGYASATVQQVLNMDVANDYVEDYHVADCSAFLHEAAIGMRLPPSAEMSNRDFIAQIGFASGRQDCRNLTGLCDYRSANTEVLSYVIEAAGRRDMGLWLADLTDAAGFEGALHVVTDRRGFPILNGGISLTVRDLARYGALFARGGQGVRGQAFGSSAFSQASVETGIPMPSPRSHLKYSNQCNTNGTWLGHGGYGGQYLVANPKTGRAACFLSVLQDEDGYDSGYYPAIIQMLAEICA